MNPDLNVILTTAGPQVQVKLGPVEKLQDIRTTIAQESADLLAVADAYEINARNLDAEAEKLRTLAREAREQEANLRRITAWRAAL